MCTRYYGVIRRDVVGDRVGTYACIAHEKHGVLSEEGMGVAIFSGMANRLPHEVLCVVPHNFPTFHVDRTHASGGICEQTKFMLLDIAS